MTIAEHRLHNFAHNSGFSLGAGTCLALQHFIETNHSRMHTTGTRWKGGASIDLLKVSPPWRECHPLAPPDENIIHFAIAALMAAYQLARRDGRRQVAPMDMTFILYVMDHSLPRTEPQ